MKKFYLPVLKTLLALLMVLTPVLFYGQNARMWRQFDKVNVISSEPTLVVKGGMVEISFEVVVPSGYFAKNAAMHVQPELRFKNGNVALKPLTLKGEEVSGDGVTINQKDGGSYTYTDQVKYDAKFNRSELYVVSTVYLGKEGTMASIEEIMDNPRSYECCNLLVANGVIYTSERLLDKMVTKPAGMDYNPVEVLNPKNTNVYFAVNKFDVNWNLKLNKDADSEMKFKELTNFAKEGWKVKSISIDGWASPEGITVNDQLSENRANVVYDEVIKTLGDLVAEGNGKFSFSNPAEDIEYLFSFRGSDWDGFMRDLKASNIKEKDAIAKSINDAADEVAQDRALRSAMYKYAGVRELLAPLRRTELAINYIEPYKTKAEIAEVAKNNPASLELKELLYAAENAEADKKLGIYEVIFDKYPKCWISKNNAAAIYMEKGNYTKAAELLNNAIEMYPDQETLNANMGALAVHQGDYAKAAEYFDKAGDTDAYNQGIMAFAKGNYKTAAELLSGNACDYNTGLAQLLAEDYTAAEATLKCTEEAPCQAAYLVAVIGARTNNASKVFENLKKAFKLHPGLKDQAKDDREFQKYWNAAEFKALLK